MTNIPTFARQKTKTLYLNLLIKFINKFINTLIFVTSLRHTNNRHIRVNICRFYCVDIIYAYIYYM